MTYSRDVIRIIEAFKETVHHCNKILFLTRQRMFKKTTLAIASALFVSETLATKLTLNTETESEQIIVPSAVGAVVPVGIGLPNVGVGVVSSVGGVVVGGGYIQPGIGFGGVRAIPVGLGSAVVGVGSGIVGVGSGIVGVGAPVVSTIGTGVVGVGTVGVGSVLI